MKKEKYFDIVKHYESCFDKYGDTHLGVDWPKAEDVKIRHTIMLELIRTICKPVTLLDFGCGLSHLYEHMVKNRIENIQYAGLDLSQRFVTMSKEKFPENEYYCLNVLEDRWDGQFDYIIMNGVFTEKLDLAFDEMFQYFKRILFTVFEHCKKGLAFNVMSKHVDWEREDLFHLSFDVLAEFLTKELTRNFIIRNDYGLYEYTVYLYRDKHTGDLSCQE